MRSTWSSLISNTPSPSTTTALAVGLVQIQDLDAGDVLPLRRGDQIDCRRPFDGVDSGTAVDIPGGVVTDSNDVVAVAGNDRIGASPGTM